MMISATCVEASADWCAFAVSCSDEAATCSDVFAISEMRWRSLPPIVLNEAARSPVSSCVSTMMSSCERSPPLNWSSVFVESPCEKAAQSPQENPGITLPSSPIASADIEPKRHSAFTKRCLPLNTTGFVKSSPLPSATIPAKPSRLSVAAPMEPLEYMPLRIQHLPLSSRIESPRNPE